MLFTLRKYLTIIRCLRLSQLIKIYILVASALGLRIVEAIASERRGNNLKSRITSPRAIKRLGWSRTKLFVSGWETVTLLRDWRVFSILAAYISETAPTEMICIVPTEPIEALISPISLCYISMLLWSVVDCWLSMKSVSVALQCYLCHSNFMSITMLLATRPCGGLESRWGALDRMYSSLHKLDPGIIGRSSFALAPLAESKWRMMPWSPPCLLGSQFEGATPFGLGWTSLQEWRWRSGRERRLYLLVFLVVITLIPLGALRLTGVPAPVMPLIIWTLGRHWHCWLRCCGGNNPTGWLMSAVNSRWCHASRAITDRKIGGVTATRDWFKDVKADLERTSRRLSDSGQHGKHGGPGRDPGRRSP